ncbi:hypothetical protein J3R82DRAFT_7633 [Butyriboletus roseoflavus]|nr:hypothetical protein J3R82DRAFT_7633 [Butyriboletus roseoflavus]
MSFPPPSCQAVHGLLGVSASSKDTGGLHDHLDGIILEAVEARGHFTRMGLSPGNEQKRFRSTNRACTLGECGNLFPCHNEACWMCETIRCGFEPHLRRKRSIPWHVSIFSVHSRKAIRDTFFLIAMFVQEWGRYPTWCGYLYQSYVFQVIQVQVPGRCWSVASLSEHHTKRTTKIKRSGVRLRDMIVCVSSPYRFGFHPYRSHGILHTPCHAV